MTNFNYSKMHEFINADPELVKLKEARLQSSRTIDSLKEQARIMLDKQHSLYISRELVQQKLHGIEDYTNQEDDLIEEVSGHNAESWSYEWTMTADVLLEGLLGHSLLLAEIARKIETTQKDLLDMNECIQKMRNTLEEQYRKQVISDMKPKGKKNV